MTTDWAISLNGAILTSGCSEDEFCAESVSIYDGLNNTPDGLGLPGIRNEDVTYYQRDGRKMFSDWYEGRTLTFTATIGPADGDCPECVDGRTPVLELAQAWKRSMVNTELVIYPPCDVIHSADNAYPPNPDDAGTLERTNLATAPRGNRWATGVNELGPFNTHTGGTYSLEATGGPTSDLTDFVRKTGTVATVVGSYIRLSTDDVSAATAVTAGNGTTVIASTDYTISVWMRSSSLVDHQIRVRYYDAAGTSLGTDLLTIGAGVAADTWVRGSDTFTTPVGAVRAEFMALTTGTVNGQTTDIAGILLEQASVLGDYFDGSTEDVYADEEWTTFAWTGTEDASTSTQSVQAATFAGTIESGPYGVVGRPRVFDYKWLNRAEKIAEVVMRFDALDQRMFILDECGTPGTSSCVDILPGSELFVRCYTEGQRCYTGAGRCYPTPSGSADSVDPVEANVGGTERVFPTITLYGDLMSPRIENMTTGEWLSYDGTISGSPVTIDTTEGTAFDADGVSKTHLLRGNLHLSMEPGNYELRLLSFGNTDDPDEVGKALYCWRDTVVVA
jgi:hypothetical protein